MPNNVAEYVTSVPGGDVAHMQLTNDSAALERQLHQVRPQLSAGRRCDRFCVRAPDSCFEPAPIFAADDLDQRLSPTTFDIWQGFMGESLPKRAVVGRIE